MGGMFSMLKVRKDQKRGDYSDPGWYAHPPGTVAYEFTGALPDPARFKAEGGGSMPPLARPTPTSVKASPDTANMIPIAPIQRAPPRQRTPYWPGGSFWAARPVHARMETGSPLKSVRRRNSRMGCRRCRRVADDRDQMLDNAVRPDRIAHRRDPPAHRNVR
jgi:hypothetical protein